MAHHQPTNTQAAPKQLQPWHTYPPAFSAEQDTHPVVQNTPVASLGQLPRLHPPQLPHPQPPRLVGQREK